MGKGTFLNGDSAVREAHAGLMSATHIKRNITGHLSQKVEAQIDGAIVAAAIRYHQALYPDAVVVEDEAAA